MKNHGILFLGQLPTHYANVFPSTLTGSLPVSALTLQLLGCIRGSSAGDFAIGLVGARNRFFMQEDISNSYDVHLLFFFF